MLINGILVCNNTQKALHNTICDFLYSRRLIQITVYDFLLTVIHKIITVCESYRVHTQFWTKAVCELVPIAHD
jgi:hypothetical protein